MKTYFKQPCPVCGRSLFVPVDLLGRDASCTHCSGIFTANGFDGDSQPGMRHHAGKQPMTMRDGVFQQLNRHHLQRTGC